MDFCGQDDVLGNLFGRFQSHFGRKATWLSRAPGRLEILGNHTDYNQGTVLSCPKSGIV